MRKLFLLLLLVGCTESPNVQIQTHETDSILIKSKETIITSDSVSKESDKLVNKKVNSVVKEIGSLKEENKALTKAVSLKTEKIIRDTIYITEKKNFWGKTKKTVDSTQSVEVDTVEN
jgi:uncharacterized protein YcfL